MMDFFDEQCVSRLYEKFILEYYRREHPHLNASVSFIEWALDNGVSEGLPVMRSDIILSVHGHVLITDTKYHTSTIQSDSDRRIVHSGNLHQISAYVKNKQIAFEQAGESVEVPGTPLYAAVDEDIQPDAAYCMSSNRVDVTAFDLNRPFLETRAQLDGIVGEYLLGERPVPTHSTDKAGVGCTHPCACRDAGEGIYAMVAQHSWCFVSVLRAP